MKLLKLTSTVFFFYLTIGIGLFSFLVEDLHAASGWKLKHLLKNGKAGVSLRNPTSLYIDAKSQRYYVIDSGNNRLLSFSFDGEPLHSFTAGGKLSKPVSMVKDRTGKLLVVEKGKASLTTIDVKSKSITPDVIEYKGRKVIPQKIRYYNDLTYALDKASGTILAVSNKKEVVRRFSCNSCVIGFIDFHVQEDAIWALSQHEGEIVAFDLGGKMIKKLILNPKPQFPASFAMNKKGEFYVIERHRGAVSIYGANGRFQHSIFSKGEKEGNLSYPIEVQFDSQGRLCVVEEGNGRVGVYVQ